MIRGSIVALVTPFCGQSCKVDWEALKNLVDWHISEGTNAIVAVGTTGESSTLNVAEHQKIICCFCLGWADPDYCWHGS